MNSKKFERSFVASKSSFTNPPECELEEFKSSIIFYGKSKDSEYLIVETLSINANLKGSNIFLIEKNHF